MAEAISGSFGDFGTFQAAFKQAALTRFGSGWAWLSSNREGQLEVHSTANQDTPVSEGRIPIIGLDVWEHAYYLKFENRRADYIAAWWNVVNWKQVSANYSAARVELGLGTIALWARASWARLGGS